MSPALNRSSLSQHIKRDNTIEIRNGILFDFYLGLPHMFVKRRRGGRGEVPLVMCKCSLGAGIWLGVSHGKTYISLSEGCYLSQHPSRFNV